MTERKNQNEIKEGDPVFKLILLVWALLCVMLAFVLVGLKAVNYDVKTSIQDARDILDEKQADISEIQSRIDQMSAFDRLIEFLESD